ncbi:hypothetical protein [Hydrocoleum sp. CS-953]|uniref:hypothetical protein n=1 Tax=Hydrocoleum sp. CS-953 TaxID=1671698 RepID=UPI00352B0127
MFRKKLFQVGSEYKWLGNSGELKEITLEKRTGATKELIEKRIKLVTTGIDYHLGHRNCEHFAYFVTANMPRSDQSIWHMFTDHDPFTTKPMINNFEQLREALLRSKHCGPVGLSRGDA